MAEKLKVFVRIRPKKNNDENEDNFAYNARLHQFTLKNKIYTIDGILGEPSQQTDVYHAVASEAIDGFIEGFNTTIFAYGQTGSGKTHTIFGPDITAHASCTSLLYSPVANKFSSCNSERRPLRSLFGLVPRSFIAVFEKLETANHIKKYQMALSCVEVYNSTLRDLLLPLNSNNLKIREDIKSKKFFVENLAQETIQTADELMLFLKRIQMNRAVSSTNMNHVSSRSHVLLQLHVIQQLLSGETKESLLTFVDLAGSEMARKTGAEGERLKEAGYINSSLSTLSRVIEGLGLQHSAKKKVAHQHIPFRDSSLTKLLKVALGGNCKTTLVVCVSVEHLHKEETYSSLRFATRAACIKNEPIINKALDAKALYKENICLKAEIERLQNMNSEHNNQWFQDKLDELEAKEDEINELKVSIDELELQLSKHDTHQVQQLSRDLEQENVKLTQNINELEIELMRERHSKENYESKLMEMQMIFSEVAAQKVLDLHQEETDQAVTKKVILDAVKLRQSMKDLLSANHENKSFRDTLLQYIDKEEKIKMSDEANLHCINPMELIKICKMMSDKIQTAEMKLKSISSDIESEECKAESNEINANVFKNGSAVIADDEPKHVVREEDIDIVVERKAEREEEKCTESLLMKEEETQTDSERVELLELAPLADTGCSFFNIFKRRS